MRIRAVGRRSGGSKDVFLPVCKSRYHQHGLVQLSDKHHEGGRVFAADGVLQRNDGPAVLWSGIERRIPGELDNYNFADDTDLHRRTHIQLRDRPERSRSDQRYRNRQPIVERRDEHLLLDPRPGVGKQPEVQCVRRSWKSLLRGEADSVSFTVRGGLFRKHDQSCCHRACDAARRRRCSRCLAARNGTVHKVEPCIQKVHSGPVQIRPTSAEQCESMTWDEPESGRPDASVRGVACPPQPAL